MDALLCSLQTGTQEIQASRSHSLRVRLGMVATAVNPISIANLIRYQSAPPGISYMVFTASLRQGPCTVAQGFGTRCLGPGQEQARR